MQPRIYGIYLKSRACACDAGLAAVKTGPDLHKYQVQIQGLRHRKQRIKTTFHFLRVTSIRVESPTAGTVRADKDEIAEVFVAARLAEICSGPYQVQYHVIRTGEGWKVDDTRLLSGQACHTL
jgi:ARC6-like, IMS domain